MNRAILPRGKDDSLINAPFKSFLYHDQVELGYITLITPLEASSVIVGGTPGFAQALAHSSTGISRLIGRDARTLFPKVRLV